MDVGTLSSNWKILKNRLGTTRKTNDELNTATKKRKLVQGASITGELNSKRHKSNVTGKDYRHKPMKLRKTKSFDQSLGNVTKADDEYPVRPSTSHSDYEPNLDTLENEGVSATAMAGKYIALDCEMVGVGPTPDQDSQLARVSMVNFHGEQIYDSYVKPQLLVTDYRTAVSGIRPGNLKVGRPFKEVQADVATFLQGRILVGHYLKSDFHCLQLKHSKMDIRDSSSLPKFRELVGGRAPKLKSLAKIVLGLEIQGGEHNSVEDARAAMMLYKAEKDAFEAENKRMFPSRIPKSQPAATPKVKKKAKKKGRK